MRELEEEILRAFTARGKTLALAESCTGGAVAARLVTVPGASDYFLGAIVAYSRSWKERFLEVPHGTSPESKEAAIAMVHGLLNETHADVVAALVGVAGPKETTEPVGTIFLAIGIRGDRIELKKFELGSLARKEIIDKVCSMTLEELLVKVRAIR
jgi:PncC family amidohydrolase